MLYTNFLVVHLPYYTCWKCEIIRSLIGISRYMHAIIGYRIIGKNLYRFITKHSIHVCTCMYMYTCTYVHVYVYIYVHVN